MALTTTQRTAKHRLAVKERMARMERALVLIAADNIWDDASDLRQIAREGLAVPDTPTTTPKTPE